MKCTYDVLNSVWVLPDGTQAGVGAVSNQESDPHHSGGEPDNAQVQGEDPDEFLRHVHLDVDGSKGFEDGDDVSGSGEDDDNATGAGRDDGAAEDDDDAMEPGDIDVAAADDDDATRTGTDDDDDA
ncbi:uncharacterized protein [Spinacia oleracea]|uniref:Uncharacterized protein n=1 Tax=Spinacia oleracea TaxID=3562 RepID=A0ABM3RQR5_SPIOL|nr:uncharacterized protein LOC130471712 [Spinacia oleracea]